MATVFIASDHRGFSLKQKLKSAFLDFLDLGPATFDPEDDYNDSAIAVAKKVKSTPDSFGILLCGSAIGVSIQANRFRGIRAAVAQDAKSAKLTRLHNDANVLCLSADTISLRRAKKITHTFLSTPFSNEERHLRRIKRLDMEN